MFSPLPHHCHPMAACSTLCRRHHLGGRRLFEPLARPQPFAPGSPNQGTRCDRIYNTPPSPFMTPPGCTMVSLIASMPTFCMMGPPIIFPHFSSPRLACFPCRPSPDLPNQGSSTPPWSSTQSVLLPLQKPVCLPAVCPHVYFLQLQLAVCPPLRLKKEKRQDLTHQNSSQFLTRANLMFLHHHNTTTKLDIATLTPQTKQLPNNNNNSISALPPTPPNRAAIAFAAQLTQP